MEESVKKILIVDDEKDIVECLDMNLKKKGYATVFAYDGTQAVVAARREKPDCILLDIMLPHIGGIEVCRLLKADESTALIPVIMLTAKGEEDDKVGGFDAGADDYITKPFGWKELFARIDAVLRRSASVSAAAVASLKEKDEALCFQVQDIRIYPDKHIVEKDSQRINLTATEFTILRLLAERHGNIVTRSELYEALGIVKNAGEQVCSLAVHFANLRKKLGDDAQNCRYIETVRKIGFKINDRY
ncbi:response regulator transcription factor [Treponema sp. HNW]|uniref:response regulator transcription factor n=1 Tax=Treponema sp. HNW TaxID=3116654 RepID=UPI003D0CA140